MSSRIILSSRSATVFAALSVMVILTLIVPTAEAIPTFARKYETSCSTCHIAIPKRNTFGEAFRKNGYKMPEGEDELVKRTKVLTTPIVTFSCSAAVEKSPDSE